GRRGQGTVRLECPTEGCPAVPIEWVMLDCATEPSSRKPEEALPPEVPLARPDNKPPPPSTATAPSFWVFASRAFVRLALNQCGEKEEDAPE
ncbi:MAG: hypothetical protein ACREF8_06745, partial [Chthoniobacterales bacterium]